MPQPQVSDVISSEVLASFFATESHLHDCADLRAAVEAEKRESQLVATQIPFDRLAKWHFDARGNLVHESGQFFSIQGARVRHTGDALARPRVIVVQPEIGILGILAQRRAGQLMWLMQLKGEPGNIGKIQVSPTVQATRSNYTAVHKGKAVPYLDVFLTGGDGHAILDTRLSEQAGCFFDKHNRNAVRVVGEDVEIAALPEFRWFTLGQILQLIKDDNLINMNTRSIISGVSLGYPSELSVSGAERLYAEVNPRPSSKGRDLFISLMNCDAKHTLHEIVEWLEGQKRQPRLQTTLVPLSEVTPVQPSDASIDARHDGFSILALNVTAGSREVREWSQPIIAQAHDRIHGFLARDIGGVLHVLLRAREEDGSSRGAEIGPTVQGLRADGGGDAQPFAEFFRNPPREHVYVSVLQSDEGGRFYRVQNRNMIVVTEEDVEAGPDYMWATLFQLKELIRRPQFVNMEARSIVSCVNCREA